MRPALQMLWFGLVLAATPALAEIDLAGKTLASKTGTFVLAPDGALSGDVKGKPLTGVWSVKQGKFCRTIKTPAEFAGKQCQAMEMKGNKLTLTREDGSTVTFTVK